MSDNEENKEAMADPEPCPCGCEECSLAARCDQCKADAFFTDVIRIVFGSVPDGAVSEAVVLAELEVIIQKAKSAMRENADLKGQVGEAQIDADRLRAELMKAKHTGQSGADIALKTSQVLSRLKKVYGDDLNWDNIGERVEETVQRLQAQAPLLRLAESELARMKKRLGDLGGGNDSVAGDNDDLRQRLDSLEGDLAFVRLISRIGGRILRLDTPR